MVKLRTRAGFFFLRVFPSAKPDTVVPHYCGVYILENSCVFLKHFPGIVYSVCAGTYVHLLHVWMHTGQRTTFRNRFSPSIMCVSGM